VPGYADVDTDQIISKEFLKRIERTGFGPYAFDEWKKDPDFVLNNPEFKGAPIMVTGPNFGCGSSREHAPWALQDYGFDVIIAPTLGTLAFPHDDSPDMGARRLLINGILWALGREVPAAGADATPITPYVAPESFDLSKVPKGN